MNIGSVKLKNNIVLAPMAGVTTASFRKICLQMGAGLVCAEMVSDKAMLYQNTKTLKMIEVAEMEHPVSMQIFGSSYETITEAAKLIVASSSVDIIDVNMGCPVNKVVKNGAGSALLKDPAKIYDIIKSLKENIDKPITAKIRAGWDFNNINCQEVARAICAAGADAITIHGRTRSQLYTGSSKLEYIKMVKEVATIPVIGNGDIINIESAVQMFDETAVDAIMIGRGALGNPWIFQRLSNYFQTGIILSKPSKEEVIATLLEHAESLVALKGEHIAMVEMRTHAPWYLKQIPQTKQYKMAIVKIKTMDELKKICDVIRTGI